MKQPITSKRIVLALLLIGVALFPLLSPSPYLIHIAVLILIWSYVVTVWSYMGRFGMVSLCHAAYMGVGVYSTFLLFNYFDVCPWVGMAAGVVLSAVIAGLSGYSCFRFGVIGHYFAITTLVIGELIMLVIIAFRDVTGGRLGLTVKPLGTAPFLSQLYHLQFESKLPYYYLALLLFLAGLYVWRRIDRSRVQIALKATGDDELAAAAVGIPIVRFKTGITVLSAAMATVAGVLYGQYISYVNPVTMVGIEGSLQICFKAILGGMYTLWGPSIGSMLIVSLEEYIRVNYGTSFIGFSNIGYALIIVSLIIFLPNGLYGSLSQALTRKKKIGNLGVAQAAEGS
jgi:branched-chain amino acid transport system permease protein